MKSTQRDVAPYITFSAAVTDAASGAGIAEPGNIPFVFTRTSAGVYTFNIDSRLIVLGGTASAVSGAADRLGDVDTVGAGTFRVIIVISAALTSGSFFFTCVARDNRS